jgi:[acyl-carrier-protein] S-malonyltransferase
MKAAFVFSGQGAQAVGMGKDLVAASAAAAAIYAEADKTLGWSVSSVCFEGPEAKLTESRYCQPAIYTTSAACLAAFKEKFPGVQPVGCAGLSLGEYGALCASGFFSFADGLKLIARRGELMDEACKATAGAMASVLGGEPATIKEVCAACGVDVANFNCPGQIVISGDKDGVAKAVEELKAKGFRKVIPLKVAGAYHSRLMKAAGEKLAEPLSTTAVAQPKTPVAQNFTGKVESDPSKIKANLVSQVAGSVLWEDCVKTLAELGADTFIEFGPGNVLTGLVKRIDSTKALFNVAKAEDLAKITI